VFRAHFQAWGCGRNEKTKKIKAGDAPFFHCSSDSGRVELYDTGASCHVSPYEDEFVTYKCITACPITMANNFVFHAVGIGDMIVQIPNRDMSTTMVTLKDVLYTPQSHFTIISISYLAKSGYTAKFGRKHRIIQKIADDNDDDVDGKVVGQIPKGPNHLYKIEHPSAYNLQIEPECLDITMLHRRMGHVSFDKICRLVCTQAITGVQLQDSGHLLECNSCKYAKSTRKNIQKKCVTDDTLDDTFSPFNAFMSLSLLI